MKTNKFCQSCGMPINRDPQKGGTEKDGSKTARFLVNDTQTKILYFDDLQCRFFI